MSGRTRQSGAGYAGMKEARMGNKMAVIVPIPIHQIITSILFGMTALMVIVLHIATYYNIKRECGFSSIMGIISCIIADIIIIIVILNHFGYITLIYT